MFLSACVSIVANAAPIEGAVMRTWQLAESVSSLRELLPGQPPNTWTRLDALSDVTLPGRGQDVLALIDGSLRITDPGEYCFELASDDGSQLWVTGTRVVDNDGLHGLESRSGCKTLDVGRHPFQIKWFQASGGAALHLRWKTPSSNAFEPVPADALRGNWPSSRPQVDGDKQIAASPAHRRPGDGRPLEDLWPQWHVNGLSVAWNEGHPVGSITSLAPAGGDRVAVGWDDGSIWMVDVRRGRATRFASDLPVPRALEVSDEAVLVAHDGGVLRLRDTDGDGVADDERAVQTLVPPGDRLVVRDGALRTRDGTILARIDPTTGIDRLLLDAGSDGTALLASPDEIWRADLEPLSGRQRASIVRLSCCPQATCGTRLPDGMIVLGVDDGTLAGARDIPSDRLAIADARPMADGIEVHLTHAVARDVLANPDHWQVEWIDAVGGRSPMLVQSASPLLNGRGAFLELGVIEAPGTIYVRLQGPWVPLHDPRPLWASEVWAAVQAPAPARTGTIVPRVTPRDNDLSPREQLDGWSVLFDGSDPSKHWRGFRMAGLPKTWRVEDGVFVFTGEGGGDIITREQYDDFDLRMEWTVQPKGNSGIFFNVAEDAGATWATGPEMQILDNARHADGRSGLTSAGSNYALDAPPFDCSLGPGRWNRARIRVRGDHVEYWLNGIKTADYHLQSPQWKAKVADSKFAGMPRYGQEASGHIALQDHGDRVAFRNIRIKRLDGDD